MENVFWFCEDGIQAHCFVEEAAGGKWRASVTFERGADYDAMKPMIPMQRHCLPTLFESFEKANDAIVGFAQQKIVAGETGV